MFSSSSGYIQTLIQIQISVFPVWQNNDVPCCFISVIENKWVMKTPGEQGLSNFGSPEPTWNPDT